ncbi:MAG: YkgJ family cysteine cluster protein [Thermodesulfobacteriota bacterium]
MKAFECKRCGACCFGEGGISVEGDEAERIAGFLGTSLESFLSAHCYSSRGRVYIGTGQNGYCIFYHPDRQCTIHPVKPRRCALWPFYPALLMDRDAWDLAKDACPGLNRDSTFEDFVRQSGE